MQPTGSGPTQDQRITIVEILGYTGTAIALVGTGAVVGTFTSGGRGVTLVVSILLAAALLVAGLVVGAATTDRLRLMRSVLWFLSVGAFQAFLGALIEPSSNGGFFLVLLLTGMAAGAVWFVLRRTLQQLALYGSVLGAILVLVAPDATFGLFGFLGFGAPDLVVTSILSMLVGTGWLALGLFGLITPPRTATVLGSLTVLFGTLILASEIEEGAFLLMALAGAALLAIGNMRSDRAVSGIGIVGLLLGAAVFFGEIASGDTGSIVALVVGVGILLAAILLGRNWGAVPAELPSFTDITPPPPPTDPSA
jgi:hypothetical protein